MSLNWGSLTESAIRQDIIRKRSWKQLRNIIIRVILWQIAVYIAIWFVVEHSSLK